jgi:hypothetical protein
MTSFLPAAAQPAARELLMTPARRIILLLGVPLSLTLLAWTCFAIISKSAQGSYSVTYSPVRVSGGLDMNVSGGDVTLQGGVAPSAAQFTGAGTVWYGLTYSGQRPTLATAQTAAGTRIDFACPGEWDNCALSSTVDVPPRVPVTLTSNGGNVTATGISDATLQTGGGNLMVNGLTGDVSLNTDSAPTGPYGGGGAVDGTLAAQNVTVDSGGNSVDLQLTTPPSNLNVTTEGGSVTLQLPSGYGYHVDNVPVPPSQAQENGPAGPVAITVTTSSSSRYRITVNADGGAVTID